MSIGADNKSATNQSQKSLCDGGNSPTSVKSRLSLGGDDGLGGTTKASLS